MNTSRRRKFALDRSDGANNGKLMAGGVNSAKKLDCPIQNKQHDHGVDGVSQNCAPTFEFLKIFADLADHLKWVIRSRLTLEAPA